MKRYTFLVIMILFSSFLYSQLTSFYVESFSDFDNNIRISYIYIEGVNNINQANNLQSEIIKNPLVSRFTFSEKKDNFNKCIIQTRSSMNEIKIKELINDILLNYKNEENEILNEKK